MQSILHSLLPTLPSISSIELFPSELLSAIYEDTASSSHSIKLLFKDTPAAVIQDQALALDISFANRLAIFLFKQSFRTFRNKHLQSTDLILTATHDSTNIFVQKKTYGGDLEKLSIKFQDFYEFRNKFFLLGLLAGQNQSIISVIRSCFQIESKLKGQSSIQNYMHILKLIQLRFRKLSQGWALLQEIAQFSLKQTPQNLKIIDNLFEFCSEISARQPRNYYIFPFRAKLLELRSLQNKDIIGREVARMKEFLACNPSEAGGWAYLKELQEKAEVEWDEEWVVRLRGVYSENEVIKSLIKEN